MKRVFLETDLSKVYILIVGLFCMILLGSYFSYAMFTVSKEKSNAISIVTGNLTYDLKVDGVSTDELVIASGVTKTFTITLSNPNNRVARFNFYYEGALIDSLTADYIEEDGFNILPVDTGVNLESEGAGSSQVYKIKVTNTSNSSQTIKLGVSVGLDYNDLTLPSDCYLFDEYIGVEASKILLYDVGSNGDYYDDGEDTFITGTDPNNYIWYSGKLWRAVSINDTDKTVKMVTEWDISSIVYDDASSNFAGSYMEMWLNDTSVDGFLGNLRDYNDFIVTNSEWNATMTTEVTKPLETTMVTDPVGLLNIYEYTMSYNGTDASNGYLNNGLNWWTLTPDTSSTVNLVGNNGAIISNTTVAAYGVRPVVNLKADIRIVSGDGTVDNPYRLEGDFDAALAGTLLNTRYSGEYITFGTGENSLYQIVSHETADLTKIVSAEPLKDNGVFKNVAFGSSIMFSSTSTMGAFLNGDYLTNYVGSNYINMIADNATWYLGTVVLGGNYRLSKYIDSSTNNLTSTVATAKVGLLRFGELLSGQFVRYSIKGGNTVTNLTTTYWLLTPYSSTTVRYLYNNAAASNGFTPTTAYGVRPTLNLKSNVVITGGDGTKENPFTLALQ